MSDLGRRASGRVGEGGEIWLGQCEVGLRESDDLAVGVEPGDVDWRRGASGAGDVAVRREGGQQLAERLGPWGVGLDLVHVVEDQAHLGGRSSRDGFGDGVDRRVADEAERFTHAAEEMISTGIGGFASDPVVVPPRGEPVLFDRLSECRGLAESGAGSDDREASLEAREELP